MLTSVRSNTNQQITVDSQREVIMPSVPHRLMVEHLVAPLGTNVPHPRLSWWLPDGATQQEAFHLQAGSWDSGRVSSPDHLFVAYEGPEPGARERVGWRVKVWTDKGESDWSAWSSWEVGLLDPSDWGARFISPVEVERAPGGHRPAYFLRHELTVEGEVEQARIYATAHGLYELFLNGARVGDIELTPGTTSYRDQLDVQTYEVTDLLRPGANVLGAVLSDGWWRGQVGFGRDVDNYGTDVALLAQLEVDGQPVAVTGPEWTFATG